LLGEFSNTYRFKGIMAEDLAVPLFDLAWLLPRTIGAERDPGRVLPSSELEVMRLLVRRPGLNVNDAAAALRLQPANVSTSVRALERRGLVERRRDEQDGRVVRLHPTALALEHREQQEAAWGESLARALADLDPVDASQLRAAAPALRSLATTLARE
jgi:DNA-binding MarR family transcriptional regulator